MNAQAQPIFLHSLHRSGSTYLFNVFRRAQDKGEAIYTCFQEPIHEVAILAKEDPEILMQPASTGEIQKLLRHPALDKPYFFELYTIYPAWKDVLQPEIVYSDYFGTYAIDKTVAYLQALIKASQKKVVIQECRTPLRITALKQRLGGIHIYLWRNPWSLWWSLKVNEYFDIIYHIILNAEKPPQPIDRLKSHIGFVPCHNKDFKTQFEFYKSYPFSPEESYLVTFMLSMLGLIEAKKSADLIINMDRLSTESAYREQVLENLQNLEIKGLDFSDCSLPQAILSETEKEFFIPLENRVLAWLQHSGYDPEIVERLDQYRKQSTFFLVSQDQPCLQKIERQTQIVFRLEKEKKTILKKLISTQQALDQTAAQKAQIDQDFQHLRKVLETTQAQIEALTEHNRSLTELAEQRAQQLGAMYASWSWKVTAPLRLGYDLLCSVPKLAAKTSRLIVLWPMQQVLQRPLLAERINQKIMRFPWLHQKLRAMAINQGLMKVPNPPLTTRYAGSDCSTSFPNLSSLSPRARQIYAQLRLAIANQNNGGL